jgi:hypothetical protein
MKPVESLKSGVLNEKVRGMVSGVSGGDDNQTNSDKKPRKSSTVYLSYVSLWIKLLNY